MATTTMATVIEMLESLPETEQEQVVEHLREYLAELHDELRWEISFQQTQPQLAAAAQRAREEIAAGKSQPLDEKQL